MTSFNKLPYNLNVALYKSIARKSLHVTNIVNFQTSPPYVILTKNAYTFIDFTTVTVTTCM